MIQQDMIGFSSNITEVKELSIEGKIAQDADRLDGIGAIGIAWCKSFFQKFSCYESV